MDVGDWLRSLGLSQYEALFRENDIDTEVLAELTESDLDRARRVARAPQAAAESDREPRFDGNCGETADRDRPDRARSKTPPSAVRSRSCFATSSARRASRRSSIPRTGAIWWELPRRRLGRRDFARRPRAEEARRRADGAVRLSPGAGERRRACRARGARDPARARRPQRAQRRDRRAGACRPHRARQRAGRGRFRQARSTARRPTSPRGCRAPPRPEKSGSRGPCTGRSPACSSPRTRASTN